MTCGEMPILAQGADAVLRGLRLQFTGGLDERHQRDVDVAAVVGVDVETELADGLEEGSFRYRDRAADSMMATSVSLSDSDVSMRMRALISSVMWGMTCTVLPRYSPRRSSG